ncbi:MAG: glucose 1-dehydrogenase [Planctomycetota bacterium]|nr:glucose 1-dehydrogenase [Planctomycetota bacterium]
MTRFQNKVLIVTGGGSGIGEATAREFVDQGGSVAVLDINDELNQKVAQDIAGRDGKAVFIHCDVSEPKDCARAVEQTTKALGRVDYLVNSAATFMAKGLDADKATWQKCMEVNVIGMFNMVQSCVPAMKQAGAGAVVNLSSISGYIAQAQRWTYNTTKGAILTMTRCMAMDLAACGIRVNSVSPGWIWTPAVIDMAGGDIEKYDPIWGRFHALRRCGKPKEVAQPILFLLSDEASFITASDLHVDGGFLAVSSEGLGQSAEWAEE